MKINKVILKNVIPEIFESFLRVFFQTAFVITFIIVLMVTTYTFYGLWKYDISFSRQSLENFLYAFNWGTKYYVTCFTMYTIFFALKKYESDVESRIYVNHLKPSIDMMIDRLSIIKSENKAMYDYFNLHGEQIIHNIILFNKSRPYIVSKEELTIYFNKYVTEKNVIHKFESSAYTKNTSDTQPVPYRDNAYNKPLSINTFLEIAYPLFCISPKYETYVDDIKVLYKANIPELNQM